MEIEEGGGGGRNHQHGPILARKMYTLENE